MTGESLFMAAIGLAVPLLPSFLAGSIAVALALIEWPRLRRIPMLWLIAGLLLVTSEVGHIVNTLWPTFYGLRAKYSVGTLGVILGLISMCLNLLTAASWSLLLAASLVQRTQTSLGTAPFWRHLRRLYWSAFVLGLGLGTLNVGAAFVGFFPLFIGVFWLSAVLDAIFPVGFLFAARTVLRYSWGRLLLVFLSLWVPLVNLVVVVLIDREIALRINAAEGSPAA